MIPSGPKLTLADTQGRLRMAEKKKKWISGAIHHPGRMKNAAAREGVSTHEYMDEHKDSAGSLGSAARLGLRLSAMSRKSKAGRRYPHPSNSKASG